MKAGADPGLIVDASVAIAWFLEDERDEEAMHVLQHVRVHGAMAPTIWMYEVANVLALAVRRKRIEQAHANEIGSALDALSITLVGPGEPDWRQMTTSLAVEHGLTAYDASYLSLALCAKARLATLDKALRAAAKSRGVQLFSQA